MKFGESYFETQQDVLFPWNVDRSAQLKQLGPVGPSEILSQISVSGAKRKTNLVS